MQKPHLNKQLQNAIYMIFMFIILAIGVFFFVTKPFAANLRTTSAEYEAMKREKIAKEQKLSDLKELEKKIEEYKTQSDALIKALPAKEDVPGILVSVEALFRDTGMPMDSFSVPSAEGASATTSSTPQSGAVGLEGSQESSTQKTQAATSYTLSKLSFGLGTTGSYSQIINFLSTLQNNLRIIRIESFSLDPAEEGTNFTFSCDITMYYLSKGSSTTQSSSTTSNTNQGTNQ